MAEINSEHISLIQRFINNGKYEEAVDAVNIVLSSASQPGNISVYKDLTSLVPQFFPTLTNTSDDYISKCCKALEKMLGYTSVEVILSTMDTEMKSGLTHPSPEVKILCLKQLIRCASDRTKIKSLTELGVMRFSIVLLADDDSSVVKYCNKCLLSLASHDEGIAFLYSEEGIKAMHEVAAISDTVRYRVYDVIIDSIIQSDQALECAVTNGLLSSLLKDLQSDDILLRLTALENVVRLADSCSAYTTLKNLGIFKGIGSWLAAGNADAMYTVPSVVKLYGKVCQKQNVDVKQFSTDNPEYFTAICDMIQHNPDPSVKLACVDVLAILGSRVDGKEVLLNKSHDVGRTIKVISEGVCGGSDEFKDRGLVALAQTFSKPDVYIPDLEMVFESWYKCCDSGLVKACLTMVQHPSPSRQCAACSLLGNLSLHKFGVMAITSVPAWSERLLDRTYCVDIEAQKKRFAVISTLRQSAAIQEYVDSDTLSRLSKYIHEGPHYKEQPPQATLEL